MAQVWLHGDSLNNHCILIAVVDDVKYKTWCEANKKEMNQENLDDQTLRDEVYADIASLCKTYKLNSLETPKQF